MRAKIYNDYSIKMACMQENNEELIILGKHVKELRKQRKLTLENLCYKNGLEPSTVARIEKGLVEPKYLTLLKLSKAFKITLSELMDF
jgi:transcriptional regulator with XRE-family HTH domain